MTSHGADADAIDHPTGMTAVFVAALLFYSLTLAPTVVWSDSGSLAWRAYEGDFRIGTAGDHPVFMVVAWLFAKFPGDVARNVNFAAAVFGALAVTLVYRAGRQLGVTRGAATVGAAALAVSHAFWLHSVIAEVYTANAFFLVAVLNLLLEWRRRQRDVWLVAAIAVFVVGLMNHLVLATMLPAMIAFVLVTKARALLSRTLALAAGLCVAIVLMLAVIQPPSLVAAVERIWYGPPGIAEYLAPRFEARAIATETLYYALFLAYQFPTISLLLGILGARALLRRDRASALLLLLTIGINAGIFIRHTVWPSSSGTKYVFYIADYSVFAILCGVGAQELLAMVRRRTEQRLTPALVALLAAVAGVPPLIYAVMPTVTARAGVNLAPARTLPYRDAARFFLNPNKRSDDGAKRFATEALDGLPEGAVLFADHTPYTVLRYAQQIEHRRPDVLLPPVEGGNTRVRWILDDNGHRRPTYLASAPLPGYYDMRNLGDGYEVVPSGVVFKLVAKE